ncbi:hypothetical protein LUZ63_004889 [Rhynchospora breviuscula]|uniref:Vesicle transport v-SNARE N-terminal domain-containing protein n=1 Tax=Rhynchospora breviuscula TaxID=2022672 RepID=A0A9Q0CLV5_9POAL|nr:hypothetical protein LUZ63_004889 [Rhynchospora breviuscula]
MPVEIRRRSHERGIFEGYKSQYSEIFDSLSQKCTSAAALEGEQRRQKVLEIRSEIEDAELLVKFLEIIKLRDLLARKTEELGSSILEDLHKQRQSLLHAHNSLHGVDENRGQSKKILAGMSKRIDSNKWIIGGVIAALAFAIIIILYFKFSH